MKFLLPSYLYEIKPLLYIALAAVSLGSSGDSICLQLAFVLLSAWALMILFMRRAYRHQHPPFTTAMPGSTFLPQWGESAFRVF